MNQFELQKVAFVAMPFGVKATGLAPGEGPPEIDFDALWDRSIFPALSELQYMPIRADDQTGSVIIKDMLEMLVFADLVIADISIPNGNVYYEAGVRHASRKTGCILISASWAKPLFDLGQITHLGYSLPVGVPTEDDYEAITHELIDGIPPLVDSDGPVFELTRKDAAGVQDARQLKEISSQLFKFQNRLRAAQIKAADGAKDSLRELVDSDSLANLPVYALQELVTVARDHLEWSEVRALIKQLPADVAEKPFFLEQESLAMSKLGDVRGAIAQLDTVIKKFGGTPERFGTIGGRYRELARDEPNRKMQRKHYADAIEAFREGTVLDLNRYYCPYKLMVTLMERGHPSDRSEAVRCATLVRTATQRARDMNRADEWLDSTMAVLAFFDKDHVRAREAVDRILDQAWPNWKLVGLSQDLECTLTWIEDKDRQPFQEIYEDLHSSLPVSQARLMSEVLPLIKSSNCRYRKFQQVHARPAVQGEVVTSTTADGEETTNTAEAGDMLVKNLTEAQELYLVGKAKFLNRYSEVEPVDDTWTLYAPEGEVLAIEISRELTAQLDVGGEFYIMAPWGSEQLAREGDMFVSPLPDLDEIYRIARKEFGETYRLED